MGQGLHTKMIQVACKTLRIPQEKIHISETSTQAVPNTTATAASISSDLNGMAIKVCLGFVLFFLQEFVYNNNIQSLLILLSSLLTTDRVYSVRNVESSGSSQNHHHSKEIYLHGVSAKIFLIILPPCKPSSLIEHSKCFSKREKDCAKHLRLGWPVQKKHSPFINVAGSNPG